MSKLAKQIDDALKIYYQKHGRTDYVDANGKGKFMKAAENMSLDDELIQDEINEDDPMQSILTEFDDNFPFKPPINDERERNIKILSILKDILQKQSFPIDLTIFADVTQDDIKVAVDRYKSQMTCFGDDFARDKDIKWFLAVSEKSKTAWLSYLVDCYTNDKVKEYQTTGKVMTVHEWAVNNPFMKALKKQYPKKKIEQNLESAMTNYSNRIMQRLSYNALIFNIKDDLQEICEYIVSVPLFIHHLLVSEKAIPPFQVDLVLAIKGVQSVLPSDNINDDDDDEEDDYKGKNAKKNYIGDIQHNLKNYPVLYYPRKKEEIDAEDKLLIHIRHTIVKPFTNGFIEFRSKLMDFNKNIDDKSQKFVGKTYPRNKRFCIVVDRRESDSKEDDDKKDDDADDIIFFQPPAHCNTIDNDHVPEFGFELIRQCILPKKVKNKDESITAMDDIGGQLVTFMFNVEAKDEIKCYIVWNGQTMRFVGDHLINVLPHLFGRESKANNAFKDSKQLMEMKEYFDKHIQDSKFEKVCNALKRFG